LSAEKNINEYQMLNKVRPHRIACFVPIFIDAITNLWVAKRNSGGYIDFNFFVNEPYFSLF